MFPRLSKNDAVARLTRKCPTLEIQACTTHFASINAGKEVWWYDIARKKVTAGQHEVLHVLAYDHRSDEIHCLVVPATYLRENLSRLVIREDKDTISLELSASRSNFLQDIRPGGGRVPFAQFSQGSQ